jgi:predicted nuclease of predicted toxin-antitoxin system
MKLLIDMNLSPTSVRFLIEAGFEAMHCQRSMRVTLRIKTCCDGRPITNTSS